MIRRSIYVLFSLAMIPFFGYGQCNEELVNKSAELLKDYTYIKDIKVSMRQSNPPTTQRYSIILSRGTRYRITTINAEEYSGELVLKIFGQKGIMVVSNYNPVKDKIYKVLDYTCKSSGQYFIEVSFKDGREGCAVCVIGFHQKIPAWLEKLPMD